MSKDPTELGKELIAGADPEAIAKVMPALRLAMKGYFRSEVRDIERVPDGGALVGSNHSGGLTPMDLPIFLLDFVEAFGTERTVYCLAHDTFMKIFGSFLKPFGMIPASRENAHAILSAGGVTMVFPGGDHDTLRPTIGANKIDFNGRTGYVRTAIDAGVPIVPVASIGGQEDQFHIVRGGWLGRKLPIKHFMRSEYVPVSIGFPWGLSFGLPINIPLPTKIVTQVTEPVDVPAIAAEYGPAAQDEAIIEIDKIVRGQMQDALDELARQRRFPVLG